MLGTVHIGPLGVTRHRSSCDPQKVIQPSHLLTIKKTNCISIPEPFSVLPYSLTPWLRDSMYRLMTHDQPPLTLASRDK